MKAIERRKHILSLLQETSQPLSANYLAKEFGVSRQVIVGDIALLRAEGDLVLATPRATYCSLLWRLLKELIFVK
jgi:transcriptional regulator of NAD metabolism